MIAATFDFLQNYEAKVPKRGNEKTDNDSGRLFQLFQFIDVVQVLEDYSRSVFNFFLNS